MKLRVSSRPPVIAITADGDSADSNRGELHDPLFVLPQRYCQAVQNAGAVPVIIPPGISSRHHRTLLERIDGLLVSGGNFDIHPRHYGEKPHKHLGHIKPERTRAELESIEIALIRDLPVLGICGGAQAINVALGGSLYQDIASQLPDAMEHQQAARKHYGGHAIEVRRGTLLHRVFGRRVLEVNTSHHQAIRDLGRGLMINATAPDGLIEGIESARHSFVLGVQWHPEALTTRISLHQKIFRFFVTACKSPGHGI